MHGDAVRCRACGYDFTFRRRAPLAEATCRRCGKARLARWAERVD